MSLSKPVLTLNLSADNGCKYLAQLDASPFEKGCFRWAFMGKLYGVSGQEPRHNTQCVIKVFKDKRQNTLENCCFDLNASIKAQEYATIFNTKTNSNTVEFLIPLVAKIDNITVPNSYFTIGAYVFIEPLLIGTYQKFNSNAGCEDRSHHLMTAFCHWTWEYSSGLHMVCDLQGVKSGEKYILTDPVIHSRNREFGITDLGPDGMAIVIINHQCNSKCLPITRQSIQGNTICSGSWHTYYDFRLPCVSIPSTNQQIPMTNQPILTAPFPHNQQPFGPPNLTTVNPMANQLTLTAPFPHNQLPFGPPNLTTVNPMTNLQTLSASYSGFTLFNSFMVPFRF